MPLHLHSINTSEMLSDKQNTDLTTHKLRNLVQLESCEKVTLWAYLISSIVFL